MEDVEAVTVVAPGSSEISDVASRTAEERRVGVTHVDNVFRPQERASSPCRPPAGRPRGNLPGLPGGRLAVAVKDHELDGSKDDRRPRRLRAKVSRMRQRLGDKSPGDYRCGRDNE